MADYLPWNHQSSKSDDHHEAFQLGATGFFLQAEESPSLFQAYSCSSMLVTGSMGFGREAILSG